MYQRNPLYYARPQQTAEHAPIGINSNSFDGHQIQYSSRPATHYRIQSSSMLGDSQNFNSVSVTYPPTVHARYPIHQNLLQPAFHHAEAGRENVYSPFPEDVPARPASSHIPQSASNASRPSSVYRSGFQDIGANSYMHGSKHGSNGTYAQARSVHPSALPSRMEEVVLRPSVSQNIPYQNPVPIPSRYSSQNPPHPSHQQRPPTCNEPGSSPRPELSWMPTGVPSQQPVDAQSLALDEAQGRAAAARARAPSAASSGSSTPSGQFLGRTYPLPSNRITSTLSSLLNPSSAESARSPSPVIPELPMSPLQLHHMSSVDRSRDIPAASPTFSPPPGPAKSPTPSHASGGSDQLPENLIVPVVRPRMGRGERNLRSKGKDTRLSDSVEAVCDYVDSEVKRLAAEHKKSLLTIKKHLGVHRRFREKKKASVYNALMHRKSQEYRIQGRVFGPSIKEKHHQMACDSEVQSILRNPNRKKAKEALEELREYQVVKLSGARASAKANDNDIVKTWVDLTRKAQNLSKRTSAATFGFVCSSRSGQNVHREFFGNGPIEGFLMSKFGMTGAEFVEAAESYCILTSTGRTATGMSVKAMQKETTQLILQGLRNVTKNEKIVMEYEHYEVLIVKEYGVKLVGWPEDIPMTSPHKLHSANTVALYQVVKSRECQWKQLGGLEKHRVVKDIEARVDSSELEVPERLRRRGKKRTAPTEKEKRSSKKRSRRLSDSDGEGNAEGVKERGSGKQSRPKPKRIPKGGRRGGGRGGILTIVSDEETEDERDKPEEERELESPHRYAEKITLTPAPDDNDLLDQDNVFNLDDWTNGNDNDHRLTDNKGSDGDGNGSDDEVDELQGEELGDGFKDDLHNWDGGIWESRDNGEDSGKAWGDDGDFDELDSDLE